MDMANEDLVEIKTQLATMASSMQRLEVAVAAYPTLERDIRLMELKQSHSDDAVSHVRERMETNASACVRADEIIHKRVDELSKDTSTFSARATGGFYVVCAMGTIVVALCTWALSQITKNTEINIEQSQRIAQVERSLTELQAKGKP